MTLTWKSTCILSHTSHHTCHSTPLRKWQLSKWKGWIEKDPFILVLIFFISPSLVNQILRAFSNTLKGKIFLNGFEPSFLIFRTQPHHLLGLKLAFSWFTDNWSLPCHWQHYTRLLWPRGNLEISPADTWSRSWLRIHV